MRWAGVVRGKVNSGFSPLLSLRIKLKVGRAVVEAAAVAVAAAEPVAVAEGSRLPSLSGKSTRFYRRYPRQPIRRIFFRLPKSIRP